ncbi:sulfonate ABC transporter substrate-binding protein, partial [Burkholderia latens]
MNDTPHAHVETTPADPRRRRWLHGAAAGLAGLALGPLAGAPAWAQGSDKRLR